MESSGLSRSTSLSHDLHERTPCRARKSSGRVEQLKGEEPRRVAFEDANELAGREVRNSALVTGLSEGYSAYASMKAGLIVLTRYMAKEFSKRRIRVNSVAPGPTRTRIAHDAFEKYPEVIPPIVARTALGRLGEAEDLGKVIASLLSEDWGWVTGENVEASADSTCKTGFCAR
jgi:NAD(P)-dependent dehydrogenase (short-subunit alcohol dehydrogenase family)